MCIQMVDKEKYIDTYLHRLGIKQLPVDMKEALFLLQARHLYSIPFENLDIVANKPISLNDDDIFEKLIVNKRGGYCFELNQSFYCLLKALGYKVATYCARVWIDGFATTPKKIHQAVVVNINGESYVAEVGFGNAVAPLSPLLLTSGIVQRQGEQAYVFVLDEQWGWILKVQIGEKWQEIFSFDETIKDYDSDFELGSFFCQYAQESPFSKGAIVFMRTETGRKSLVGKTVQIVHGGQQMVIHCDSEKEVKRHLEQDFGILGNF
ncbi:MAG: arylamine N-acetyltransferase [Acidaminococcaceae bacterium]